MPNGLCSRLAVHQLEILFRQVFESLCATGKGSVGGDPGYQWERLSGDRNHAMVSGAVKEVTRRAWRELGFYCGKDTTAKEWRIVGSVKGLKKFATEIRRYASNPAHDRLSEYMHLGPAMNLEICTSHQTEITDQWIGAPVMEFHHLAALVDRSVQANMVGKRIALRANFSPMASYELILDVRDDAFDPASADPACG